MTPTHEVEVHMVDGLPAILAGVDHQSVAAVEAQLPGEAGGLRHHVGEQFAVVGGEIVHRGVVAGRDHQNVHRSLRVDVVESNHSLIAVNEVGRDLTVDDSTEQAFSHGTHHVLLPPTGAGHNYCGSNRSSGGRAHHLRTHAHQAGPGSNELACLLLGEATFRADDDEHLVRQVCGV